MESVSEGGEGREGSEVKRGDEGRRGSARVSEGRAKSSSFFISTMKDFSIFTVQSPLFKRRQVGLCSRREIGFSV